MKSMPPHFDLPGLFGIGSMTTYLAAIKHGDNRLRQRGLSCLARAVDEQMRAIVQRIAPLLSAERAGLSRRGCGIERRFAGYRTRVSAVVRRPTRCQQAAWCSPPLAARPKARPNAFERHTANDEQHCPADNCADGIHGYLRLNDPQECAPPARLRKAANNR